MAFEWLMTPDNLIEVRQKIVDRNEDTIAEIVIGTGYGMFRGQTELEYTSQVSANFTHMGTIVFYTPTDSKPVVVNGKEYSATHKYPSYNDLCTWRGTTFVITGVDFRPDVHGDMVGFNLRCSDGETIR